MTKRRSITSSREALRARRKLTSSDLREVGERLEAAFGSDYSRAPELAQRLMCAALIEDWAEIRETPSGPRMVFKRGEYRTKWASAWRTARGNPDVKQEALMDSHGI